MHRRDINPVFKQYDSVVYNIKDYTIPAIVKVYAPSGYNKLEYGVLLYEYEYDPLLNQIAYLKLLAEFDSLPILVSLYARISLTYNTLYFSCYKWYKDITSVDSAFNLEEQINKYDLKTIDESSCPIIRSLDPERMSNINCLTHFKSALRKAEIEDIADLDVLYYGEEGCKKRIGTAALLEPVASLQNAIVNIVYIRFKKFLLSENDRIKTLTEAARIKTLQTNLKPGQLRNLYTFLINELWIEEIPEHTFIYLLSGNWTHDNLKIRWRKSKGMAMDLFKRIATNFSMSTLNSCVTCGTMPFDSNNRAKTSYAEIDDIIDLIKNFPTP